MQLYYRQYGSGSPIIILHGLLGSSDNWQGIAKQLANSRCVISVDLRNHGRSAHQETMNFPVMAQDIAALIEELSLAPCDVIGHSMGGKVGMFLAQQWPELIDKLIVVDMSPRVYQDSHSGIFDALQQLDLANAKSRKQLDQALQTTISQRQIRQFLLMNLIREQGQFAWRINLPVIVKNYPNLCQALPGETISQHRTLFIRGGLSDYISSADIKLIKCRFPRAEISTIEDAGHWIHVEKPESFLEKVEGFINAHHP